MLRRVKLTMDISYAQIVMDVVRQQSEIYSNRFNGLRGVLFTGFIFGGSYCRGFSVGLHDFQIRCKICLFSL